jgi:hypothetical protein
MPARNAVPLGAILLFGASLLRGAPVVADPHDLYMAASNELTRGDLPAAGAALARLRAVIRSSPQWDPEGVFSRELLPPLEARLKRLQGVAGKLDRFSARALEDLKPPDPLKDTSTVRTYTDWATSVVQRLRTERDRIVSGELARPEERAILMRTESYARTQRILETDALRQMGTAAGDDILGLLAGDPNQESILLRFRTLKLELMQAVADRDRLGGEIAKSDVRQAALLRALGAVVSDGAQTVIKPGAEPSACVVEQFDRFLDAERATLGARRSITSAEQVIVRADLDRYRRYKQALATVGITLDPGGRIDELEQTIESISIGNDAAGSPGSRAMKLAAFAAALALSAGLLMRVARVGARRRAARIRSFDDTRPGLVAGTPPSNADRDVA